MELKYPIILASQSPRRQQILKMADLDFQVQPAHIDENCSISDPVVHSQNLAMDKAHHVAKSHPDAMVIGADTIVVLDCIIGKPHDAAEAKQFLQALSGQAHWVYTGVAIFTPEGKKQFYEASEVHFHELENWQIEYYIREHKPFDKAGSYGIQDWGAQFVRKVNGCFFNVMGFPLAHFMQEVKPWIVRENGTDN